MASSPHPHVYAPTAASLKRACELLRAGELVGMPTETVYGLAAHAENAAAVARIFAAKGRPQGHPLIVHVASIAEARALSAAWPARAEALAAAYWPGPLTLIVPRGPRIPDVVTGGRSSVALRVPAHPVALALLQAFGAPLAAPSANRHEHLSPTRPEHVLASLGSAVDFVLDGGPAQAGIESTLIDLTVDPPRLLRPGPLGASALRVHLPSLRTDAVVVSRERLRSRAEEPGTVWLARALLPGRGLTLPDEPAGFAAGLYAALYALENFPDAERILVESPPAEEAWVAVADRLGRASFS